MAKKNYDYTQDENLIEIETFKEDDYKDWKKVEIEILRDRNGNCLCIGSREFINDNISVFPVLTIPNKTYQLLRQDCFKIATTLRVVGNINIKYVVEPEKFEYKLVNYTVREDNTLIESATNYPMLDVRKYILQGTVIDEIMINGKNMCYEPIFEKVVIEINGYMITANNLEEGIIKSSCLDAGIGDCFWLEDLVDLEKRDLREKLKENDSKVFLVIAEAIRKEMAVEKICEITKIDKYFVGSVYKIIKTEKELELNYINDKLVEKAMNLGISIPIIALLSEKEEDYIKKLINK